jgi:hypothetical protein
MDTSGCG